MSERGHRLKLDRALEHLNLLDALVQPWVERQPWTVVAKSEVQTHKQGWYLEILTPPPIDRIALLVGDTLHNLRQSIDHLTFALSWNLRGSRPGDNVSFPVCDNPQQFEGSLGNICSPKKIPPAVRAALENVQPYKGGNYQLIKALKEMHDLDKHQTPTVVAGGVSLMATGIDHLHFAQVQQLGIGASGFVEDGAPVFEFIGDLVPDSDVGVHFQVAPNVGFGAGTPIVAGQPVGPVLRTTRDLIVAEIAAPLEGFV